MSYNTAATTDIIDYYHVLNLQPQWDVDKLKKELLKKLAESKGRINGVSGDKKKQVEDLIKLIPKATKTLLNPESRAKYDQELADYKRTATPEQQAAAAGILTLAELWALIDAGRYLDAVEAGKRLVNHEPENDRAWEVYGYASYQRKDINTAIYAAEQAIQCNPRNAEYYSDAGGYLAAADRWDEAIVQLNKAIQLEPTNISYKLTLSNIHVQHESWDDAEAILKGVLSQEPSNQTAQSFMAIVIHDRAVGKFPQVNELARQGKKKEARNLLKEIKSEFEKAQKLVENDPDMRELLTSNSIEVRRALGVNSYQRIFGFLLDSLFTLPGLLLLSTGNTIAVVGGCVYIVVVVGYSWVYLAAKNDGQDLTKRISGMQIINDDSNSYPGVEKLIFRAILKPITLAAIFMAIVLAVFAAYIPTIFENDGFKVVGMIIGLVVFFTIGIFRMLWELLFITDKDLAPGLLGFVLFLHDKLTKTTVACSARDSVMNFSSYKWYGNSKEKITLLIIAGLMVVILALSGFSLWKGAGQQPPQEITTPSSAPPVVDSSQSDQTSKPSNSDTVNSNPSVQQSSPQSVPSSIPQVNNPSSSVQQSSISPTETISNYYRNLKSSNYEAAWSLLPERMQNDLSLHPKGYQSFSEWYSSIGSIDINNISLKSDDGQNAIVSASTNYIMKSNRRLIKVNLSYFLTKDTNNEWKISKIKRN
jgi:tetratricopeptide (TPR) repeat protein